LLRKHWTHRQIAEWLNKRGVKITLSSVHRFCQRAIARRPRSSALEIASEKPVFNPTPQSQPKNQNPVQQHRFNLDI
jgi:hypothetical protein